MLSLEQTRLDKLLDEFKTSIKIQYSGRLNVKSSHNSQWTFYYHLGQIVWATGGNHPYRRLYRYVMQNCPHIEMNKLLLHVEDTSSDYWGYRLLEILYKKYQVTLQQIDTIIRGTISEVLFDLAQHLNRASLLYERHQEVILTAPNDFTSSNIIIQQIQESWNIWSKAGLATFSPHLAPIIRKPEQLQQMVSPTVYKNFANLMNGKYTLWDLAVKMNQSILSITRSLLPYIRQGIIELIAVPDFSLPTTELRNSSNVTPLKKLTSPLIACVDDSPQVGKLLQEILISNGFRFINIQEPLQALPILIQHKPDLIFLDLIMPGVNGYELCAQLRRSSALSKTPVVILTGSDGLFDKVRSKVFGATDFVTKPIEVDKLLERVRQYLPNAFTANNVVIPQPSSV
ncbi:response regulator [Calothrix membranacea FACHB-236]|nr:response regulator [Calothrix membranacea FACHB-236]